MIPFDRNGTRLPIPRTDMALVGDVLRSGNAEDHMCPCFLFEETNDSQSVRRAG